MSAAIMSVGIVLNLCAITVMFRRLIYRKRRDVIIKIESTTRMVSARAVIKTFTTKHFTSKSWSSLID